VREAANLFDLTGKHAVVTGCTRGIGRAMAEALALAGADISGVSASMPADGGETGDAVRSHGQSFTAHATDLSDGDAVRALAAELTRRDERPVDILVNNAGTIRREPAITHTDEDWNHVLTVDLSAPFLLSRAVGATMTQRGQGKIIFTASMLSFQGGINVVSYTAAKSGIAGLTRALANEWAPHGVNVNAIAPGYIATDNTRALRDDPTRSRAIVDRIPAGRWGLPADLAGVTVFLSSPAADYVHGAIIPVDGGWLGR
jgi:2-deoxy-D-gluconate 3-dehydrogenase